MRFADWAQLKRLHGGESITSASPLQDRQRLMLDIVHSEALPMELGIDRLAIWPEAWGWDSTDLAWEAWFWDGRAVLRFGEHWDPERLREGLERFGYRATATGVGEIWQPRDDVEMPRELRLRRMMGGEFEDLPPGLPDTAEAWTPLTIAPDGRTVILHFFGLGAPLKGLKRASRADPDRVYDTPTYRAAAVLDRPVAAEVFSGPQLCQMRSGRALEGAPADALATVATLHDYKAMATGYSRDDATAPAEGRFVFSYARPRPVANDLAARGLLVERPYPWLPTDEPGHFILSDAQAEGSELVLGVLPATGQPAAFFDFGNLDAYFTMCGPKAEPA